MTDCGVQYTSKEFEPFARSYNFEHVLVSPKHPRVNGEAEAAVKTVKSTLPIACGLLEPETHNIKEIRARMKYGKEKLKYYHDCRDTKELPPLKPDDFVRVKPKTGSKD